MLLANLTIQNRFKMADFHPTPAAQLTNEKRIEKKTSNFKAFITSCQLVNFARLGLAASCQLVNLARF